MLAQLKSLIALGGGARARIHYKESDFADFVEATIIAADEIGVAYSRDVDPGKTEIVYRPWLSIIRIVPFDLPPEATGERKIVYPTRGVV